MSDFQTSWQDHYATVPQTLAALRDVPAVVSVFNTNIDAVRTITPAIHEQLAAAAAGAPPAGVRQDHAIATPGDLLRGFRACFGDGVAQEWLVTDQDTFRWLERHVGHDRLQMGGQGGIIANVMAVCGVQNVLVHAASLPAQQAAVFVDRPNLLAADAEGRLRPARQIDRPGDVPLIHWILEFRKGDTITVEGEAITCPRSNRFIATWDPLNFVLAIDPEFVTAVSGHTGRLEYCLLSGYQMLAETLATGETAGDRIRASKEVVDRWRADHPELVVHFEFASTQDRAVRARLLAEMSGWVDSIGLNEQELADVLEVAGETDLAAACRRPGGSVELLAGLGRVFELSGVPRIQLHFYGLYVTLQAHDWRHTPEQTRNGMTLAATVAASKAGTGSIDTQENLLWAHGQPVGEVAGQQLAALADHLAARDGASELLATGIHRGAEHDVIAVPTIIVENPRTLVGMGDTISSLSLVGAR
jgi:ADP-dependent phosphofructokinase/glucokinase